jgi:hypothetical protein
MIAYRKYKIIYITESHLQGNVPIKLRVEQIVQSRKTPSEIRQWWKSQI